MKGNHYDVIVIGTGAGGGTLLSKLAPSGKRILVLERGGFLPREKENWSPAAVFKENRYHTTEIWLDKDGKDVHPGTGYWVGGNTKVYGAALFRLRKGDFREVQHSGGAISPAWPLNYEDLEPYYHAAEILYRVHGRAGEDPTEAPRSAPYPFPPVSDEPRIAELRQAIVAQGLHPFTIPLGLDLDERDPVHSPCIKCNTCDGFPCLVHAKADSEVMCVRPAMLHSNVTLATGALVTRLVTGASGREITAVEVAVDGKTHLMTADIVVVAAGAINSAALLLRSANDRHPQGLANGSGLVGRNFMKHHNGSILAVARSLNPTTFQKTIAVNDFYWGDDEFPSPMGHVQLLGKVSADMLSPDAPGFAPDVALEMMAHRSIDWWLTAEDLGHRDNRVRLEAGRIVIEYEERNVEGFQQLMKRWKSVLEAADGQTTFFPHALYFRKTIPLAQVGHQCGTCRFGVDPALSVLDVMCRAHEVDNLYVVDGSFFPSSGAVNPSLTIMANALRVGDHLLDRLH